jgi:hypothetical protein
VVSGDKNTHNLRTTLALTSIFREKINVRFTPQNGRSAAPGACLLSGSRRLSPSAHMQLTRMRFDRLTTSRDT